MGNRYRVWCLTWEDDEAHGLDIAWYRFSEGEPPPTKGTLYSWEVVDPESAAEVYAAYAHDNRDGYEDTWPLAFRVRCPDGSTVDIEVEREYEPRFTARMMAAPGEDADHG